MSLVLLGGKGSEGFVVKIIQSNFKKDDSTQFRPADEVFKELAVHAKNTNYDFPTMGQQ